jgi:hypothetical protein
MTQITPTPTPHYWQHPLFWVLAIIGMTIPFWVTSLPPLMDLPGHMARYHVMRELPNSPDLQRYYEYKWMLIGNLGVDLFVYALKAILTVQQATWLACVITVMLTTLAIPLLSKTFHGEIQLSAVAALPLVYAHFFFWGFLNYNLSVALALLAFVLWKKLENQLRLRALVFIPLSCLVWLCHTIGWGIMGLCIAALELERLHSSSNKITIKGLLSVALRMLPTALPFILILYWRAESGGETFMYKYDYLTEKAYAVLYYMRGYNYYLDIIYTFLLFIILLYSILYYIIKKKNIFFNSTILLAGLYLFFVYIIMPTDIFGSAFSDARLVHVFMLLIVLAIRDLVNRDNQNQTILPIIILLFVIIRTSFISLAWYEDNKIIQNSLTALKYIKNGSRVLTFTLQECAQDWKINYSYNHLDSMLVVYKNAFTNGQWKILGAQPLSPIYNQDTLFGSDPSQYIRGKSCGLIGRMSFQKSINNFPRSRFDYVWILSNELITMPMPMPSDLKQLYKDKHTSLYAIQQRK